MNSLLLYIEGQLVDLFPDETVNITETIQNVRDVGKIFTDFTQTFNVPASPRNNLIFKHYYNFNIVNGFDARVRVNANLELNLIPFKKGKIKLEGTTLKNGKISTYKVTFFGETIEIKDRVKEDKLNALDLSAYDLDYSTTNIKTGLQSDPTTNDVIVPLITHSERLTYNSLPTTETGNLFYVAATNRGVLWSELKYALRVDAIIQAIASKYDLNFNTDFFNSTNKTYYDLFMWCHRKKGNVENPNFFGNDILVDGFPVDGDTSTSSSMDGITLSLTGGEGYQGCRVTTQTASADEYVLSVYRDGIQIFSSGKVTGNYNANIDNVVNGDYVVYISSDVTINFTDITWEVNFEEDPTEPIAFYDYSTGAYLSVSSFVFNFSQQIPEIKVIDFLTGIFKMFNLTAYFDKTTDEIIVDTLDNFYASGVEYDVTRYVDVTSHDVNTALPYKQIDFGYEGLGTFLAENHSQLFNFDWGEENYNAGEDLDGEVYEVLLPFEHMKYERLIDGQTGNDTDIQYGYSVDDNQDSYIGEPLLFYPVRQVGATTISFRDTQTTNSAITSYIVPSNSYRLDSSVSAVNINFKNEINEYTRDTSFVDTLYRVYYSNYIEDVFNSRNRLSRYKLRLPLRIINQYTLADRFIINGNKYKINAITTNLTTLESDVELLNDFG